jgi:hypothetical protein
MIMHRRLKKFIVSTVVGAILVSAAPSQTSAVVSWQLTDDAVSLGMNGVSPHVERVGAGDRVWRSDMVPSGTAVSLCTDAGACSPETLATGGGPVSDFAVAQTASGTRAYFKRMDMASNTQAVYSAACLTGDCLSIGTATLASSGMQVSKDERAWGVPDPVRLPDGRIRIYIVESPVKNSSCPEKVASYISADGISFTKESGWRLEGGFVDTEVLRAKNGEWLMIMANGPGCGARQQLFVASSNDGLTWSTPQVLTGTDQGRLDPTGYETAPGSNVFRIYYAQIGAGNNFTIKRATLKIGSGKGVTAAGKSSKVRTTITCVKGKTTKKVTAVNAKCPKGFKQR